MLYGAAAAGSRVMTASSGPGIALMSEGLSYLAGARLPSVVIDMQRAGPGLGNIWPEQGDYNMVVKGGGHGNYKNIVLTPASVQEMYDFTKKAFELADKYRMTVFILSDAYRADDGTDKLNGLFCTATEKSRYYGDKRVVQLDFINLYESFITKKTQRVVTGSLQRVEQAQVDYVTIVMMPQQSLLPMGLSVGSVKCSPAVKKKGDKSRHVSTKNSFSFPK